MAAGKTARKKKAGASKTRPRVTESHFTVVLEDLHSKFNVFGEALQALGQRVDARFEQIDARFEQIDARFEQIDARFGRVEDAIRTHSKELERIEAKIDTVISEHGARLDKLEGAAE